MGEEILRAVTDAGTALFLTVASVLLPPTILLVLLRAMVPAIGAPLLQAWGRLVGWLILAPIRLVQFLSREAFGRHRR